MTSENLSKAAKDIGANVSDRVASAASSTKTVAETARGSVRDFTGRAADAAADFADHTKGHVREAIDHLPDASEAVAAGRRTYDRGARTVETQVKRQPLEALLLAGAIGYLVGWATNRS